VRDGDGVGVAPPPREINAFRDVYWKLETKSKELVPYPKAVSDVGLYAMQAFSLAYVSMHVASRLSISIEHLG
jgi:hypothetical protein